MHRKLWLLALLTAVILASAIVRADDDGPDCDNIKHLEQTGETETSITIEWDIDTAALKYKLTIDDFITTEFLCSTTHCTHDVTGLAPCKTYDLSLVAVCDIDEGDEIHSDAESIDGFTAYSIPGPPTNLDDDGTSQISWEAPDTNGDCVAAYRVCYRSEFTGLTVCTNTTDTFWDYGTGGPSGCDELHVTVSPWTGDGQLGGMASIPITTATGVPSEPTNFEVQFQGEDELLLQWDAPVENAACVHDWSIQYGPADNGTLKLKASMKESRADQEYSAVITNLLMCTDYKITVQAVTVENDMGPPATAYTQTDDSAPGLIPDIGASPGTDNIIITWGEIEDPCVGMITICITDPGSLEDACYEVDPGTGDGGSYTIDGLVPCRTYGYLVEGVSPGGANGAVSIDDVTTLDVPPGKVQNLAVQDRQTTSITISWDAPVDYPDCVHEYIIGFTNLEDTPTKQTKTSFDLKSEFTDTFVGLDACVNYQIDVWAVSTSGLEGVISTIHDSTLDMAPEAPRNPEQVSNQADGVTILFYAPENRFCVEDYLATFVEKGGSGEYDIYFIPSEPYAEQFLYTFSSPDLTSCTEYELQLRAQNEVQGSSAPTTLDVMTAC